jgi:hypothetical protein
MLESCVGSGAWTYGRRDARRQGRWVGPGGWTYVGAMLDGSVAQAPGPTVGAMLEGKGVGIRVGAMFIPEATL